VARKISHTPGSDPRFVRPAGFHCNDYVIPAAQLLFGIMINDKFICLLITLQGIVTATSVYEELSSFMV